jgi:two-component system, response regulator PdtaR
VVILIVDDEALIGMALKLVLRVAGFRVLGPAASVAEALELAAAERPDVALVDVNLAGDAEGVEVARALRDRHGTVCIFVTGQPELARSARDAALGVIAKPFDPLAVVRVVETLVARRSGAPPESVPRPLELFHQG